MPSPSEALRHVARDGVTGVYKDCGALLAGSKSRRIVTYQTS